MHETLGINLLRESSRRHAVSSTACLVVAELISEEPAGGRTRGCH